ncbi:MAG: ion transporter [Planctomycetota bacterium]|nr:ion transporter [Planctomycetota bacterium]
MTKPGSRTFDKPKADPDPGSKSHLKEKIHEIIFEADTPAGMAFDVFLLVAILLSILPVCLDSVEPLHQSFGQLFWYMEWFFAILFTIEYLLRIYCVRRPWRYVTSFFGIVDLMSFLPTYLIAFISPGTSFAVLRALRLLRVFRIFKLVWLMNEANEMGHAILQARGKIVVFFSVVLISVCMSGTLMYEIENFGIPLEQRVHREFSNIPESIYWAITTMTTVGYGDIVPTTVLGKIVSSMLILLGYSLIIVPTGFVSAEFLTVKKKSITTRNCQSCANEGHDADAIFCKYCGEAL